MISHLAGMVPDWLCLLALPLFRRRDSEMIIWHWHDNPKDNDSRRADALVLRARFANRVPLVCARYRGTR